MKKTGIILLVLGLLITIFSGVSFVTTEKVVDIGDFEITADQNHTMDWSPYLGVVLMVVGGGVYMFGGKRS